jgi:hypothetical protein
MYRSHKAGGSMIVHVAVEDFVALLHRITSPISSPGLVVETIAEVSVGALAPHQCVDHEGGIGSGPS